METCPTYKRDRDLCIEPTVKQVGHLFATTSENNGIAPLQPHDDPGG
ncbi:hypothetical protein [Pelodictyon luteolum]|nr:hypothetical protein [Pelodictyon luteolum]